MEQFSVLIPDGESIFTLFVMHGFIGKPNVKLYVLSSDRWASPRFSRYCHKFIHQPIGTDYQERCEAIARLAKQFKIDVLLPVETDWIEFAGTMRSVLLKSLAVVPVPDPKTLHTVHNKGLLAQCIKEHQVHGPPTL